MYLLVYILINILVSVTIDHQTTHNVHHYWTLAVIIIILWSSYFIDYPGADVYGN